MKYNTPYEGVIDLLTVTAEDFKKWTGQELIDCKVEGRYLTILDDKQVQKLKEELEKP